MPELMLLLPNSKQILDTETKKMGIEQHEDFWGNEGTDWETTKSADAPLENGCSESLIRSTNISTY